MDQASEIASEAGREEKCTKGSAAWSNACVQSVVDELAVQLAIGWLSLPAGPYGDDRVLAVLPPNWETAFS